MCSPQCVLLEKPSTFTTKNDLKCQSNGHRQILSYLGCDNCEDWHLPERFGMQKCGHAAPESFLCGEGGAGLESSPTSWDSSVHQKEFGFYSLTVRVLHLPCHNPKIKFPWMKQFRIIKMCLLWTGTSIPRPAWTWASGPWQGVPLDGFNVPSITNYFGIL